MSLFKQLILQVILILFNSFFAATEIAVISLNTTKLRKMIEEGDKKAEKLLHMAENPSGFLSTIQIGITLAGFLGSAFAADNLSEHLVGCFISWGWKIPVSLMNTIAVVLITLVISFFTLIFGELVPKRIAQQKAMRVARFSVSIISALAAVMKPVIWLLSTITNLVLRLFRLKTDGDEEQVTEDDIRLMVDAGGESGSIEEDEQEWIQNVFEFNDISVSDVMTREPDVIAFQLDTPEDKVLSTIKETGLSRYPVYGEDINDIIGTLNAREFLLNLSSEKKKSMRELLRKPYLIPESIKADKLFKDMQIKKIHLAIVVDEYGQTTGIITLEDLLEEIVGNIYDEYDPQEEAEIQKIDEGKWRVSGSMSIEDLNEETGLDIKESEDYDTIAGMVLSTLSQIPEDGSQLDTTIDGLDIHVTRIDDRRIEEVEIQKHVDDENEKKDEE
ncbi:MAG: hemolysin family protein [Candidatus Ornithospirochaeta sp.]|nr:hemolysin family protein [Candidatus Ornithospirochaeta sp.]